MSEEKGENLYKQVLVMCLKHVTDNYSNGDTAQGVKDILAVGLALMELGLQQVSDDENRDKGIDAICQELKDKLKKRSKNRNSQWTNRK